METLRNNILHELKKKDLTIPELCDILNITDVFDMCSAVAELGHEDIVKLKSFKTCYQPDGCAVYIARYGV